MNEPANSRLSDKKHLKGKLRTAHSSRMNIGGMR
jgi:hypothetical protein